MVVSTKRVPGVPGMMIGGSLRPTKWRAGAPPMPGATPIINPASAAFTDGMSFRLGFAPINQNWVVVVRPRSACGSIRNVMSTRRPSSLIWILVTRPASTPW